MATHAGAAVARSLRERDPGPEPIHVLAVGKAACAMAQGAHEVLGTRIVAARVTTKDEPELTLPGFVCGAAAHPLPDDRSVTAARDALDFAAGLGAGERLLVLISGGASALWCAPAEGLTLAAKRELTQELLRSGADIAELNAARIAHSRIKGGGLARALGGACLTTLAVSDVAGDDPQVIGSGPTVGETGPVGDYRVVASLARALAAVDAAAIESGLRARELGAMMYGDVETVCADLVAALAAAREDGIELLVACGEPTVRVRGAGRGGRAQQLALLFARAIDGRSDTTALFAGTDGSDGPTDAAGAFCDSSSGARARALGLDLFDHIDRNDAYPLLARLDDLYTTGPTHTNVNDLALIRVR